METEEIIATVNKHLLGQGSQVDVASVLPKVLLAMLDIMGGSDTKIGDLADLFTDHKSDLVGAINEVADLVETQRFVVSFEKTSDELKEVYNACAKHLILAKNIVFYNSTDQLYYMVNGYNMVSEVLKLHTIMQGDSGLMDTVVNLSANGTLSVG